MGVVKKQSIQNTAIQYIGVVLGYFNAVVLFTNILDTEQFGLTRILFAIASIYINVASVGTFKILVRFFPHFKGRDASHNGFLTFNLLLSLAGFLITTILFILLKKPIEHYANGADLFTENYYYVVLLSFVMLYATVLESYLMAMKKTVMANFLRNILLRIVWMLEIGMFHYGWISFDTFIFLYVMSYFLNFLIMLIQLIYMKEVKFSLAFFRMDKKAFMVILNYGFFSIVSGISSLIVNRIDIIMISFLLGLSANSIYSIASYISSVLMVPSQSLYRITMPVVAEQWKKKDMKGMLSLYQKSSINQLLFGGFVFLCIWINVDDIFKILPEQYSTGKWVMFILSMSIISTLVTGINPIIITVSRFYKYDTVASIVLGILTIITNFIFIPIWGIEGAALATFISVFIYQTYKFLLVYQKTHMQPFNNETLICLAVIGITYLLALVIPDPFDNFLLRICYKSTVIAFIFFNLIWWLGIAEDIRHEMTKYLRLTGIIK